MKTAEKPKGVTNKDLQEAIVEETKDLIKENRELIMKRAHKRLIEKFRR